MCCFVNRNFHCQQCMIEGGIYVSGNVTAGASGIHCFFCFFSPQVQMATRYTCHVCYIKRRSTIQKAHCKATMLWLFFGDRIECFPEPRHAAEAAGVILIMKIQHCVRQLLQFEQATRWEDILVVGECHRCLPLLLQQPQMHASPVSSDGKGGCASSLGEAGGKTDIEHHFGKASARCQEMHKDDIPLEHGSKSQWTWVFPTHHKECEQALTQ